VAVEHFRDDDDIWARLMLQVGDNIAIKPQNCLNQLGPRLGLELTTEAGYDAATKKRIKHKRTERPLLVAEVHEATKKFFEIIKNMPYKCGQFKHGGRKKRARSEDDTVTEGAKSGNAVTKVLSKDGVIKQSKERIAQLEHELEQLKKQKRARVNYNDSDSDNSNGSGDNGSDSGCSGDSRSEKTM
jgi:hypothetical protein